MSVVPYWRLYFDNNFTCHLLNRRVVIYIYMGLATFLGVEILPNVVFMQDDSCLAGHFTFYAYRPDPIRSLVLVSARGD